MLIVKRFISVVVILCLIPMTACNKKVTKEEQVVEPSNETIQIGGDSPFSFTPSKMNSFIFTAIPT